MTMLRMDGHELVVNPTALSNGVREYLCHLCGCGISFDEVTDALIGMTPLRTSCHPPTRQTPPPPPIKQASSTTNRTQLISISELLNGDLLYQPSLAGSILDTSPNPLPYCLECGAADFHTERCSKFIKKKPKVYPRCMDCRVEVCDTLDAYYGPWVQLKDYCNKCRPKHEKAMERLEMGT